MQLRRSIPFGFLCVVMLSALVACGTGGESTVQKTDPPPRQAGMMQAGGVELHYEAVGTGDAVLLLHGGGLDGRMWDPQMESLGRRHRIVRCDLPGHGKSPVPPNSFCHGEVLHDLLNDLGVERAHVVGLSGGAIAGLHLAIEHPEMVRTLVLVAPGLEGWDWSQEFIDRMVTMITAAHEQGPEVAAEMWLTDPCMVPAMERPELRDRLRQLHFDNAHTWSATIKALPLHPAANDLLPQVEIPTLIIVGDRDVEDVRAISERLSEGLPDSRMILLPGVGHMLNLEAPQEFDAAVLAFLSQHRN
jgi:pimeloyl-ACP methyl ester carboxylesterase